jgi:hypothetical protein
MQKRLIFLAALAMAALGGCSVGLPPDVAGLGYVNRPDHFAMDVPPGWRVRESTGPVPLTVTRPGPDGPGRPNLNVTVLAGWDDQPLPALVQSARRGMSRLEGFEPLSEEDFKTAGGRAARLATFRATVDDRPVLVKQMYVAAGSQAYILTASASQDAFADEAPAFDVCFRSFRADW